ncbi:MAG: hypothetical protein WCK51_12605 [Armatimonadota bacterium]
MLSLLNVAALVLTAQNPGDLSTAWKPTPDLPEWVSKVVSKKLPYSTPLYRIARVTPTSVHAWDVQGMRDLAFEKMLELYLQGPNVPTFPAMFKRECRLLYFRTSHKDGTPYSNPQIIVGNVTSNYRNSYGMGVSYADAMWNYQVVTVLVGQNEQQTKVEADASVTFRVSGFSLRNTRSAKLGQLVLTFGGIDTVSPVEVGPARIVPETMFIRSKFKIGLSEPDFDLDAYVEHPTRDGSTWLAVDEEGKLIEVPYAVATKSKTFHAAQLSKVHRALNGDWNFTSNVRAEDLDLLTIIVTRRFKITLDGIPMHPKTRPY